MQNNVFWITGLSGAGKTTIAHLLREQLQALGHAVILLDGDTLRHILGNQFGHDPKDRQQLGFIYARLCQELAQQGFTVICATISLFHALHTWNRTHIPHYKEIYLTVPLEERKERDPKGLYQQAQSGEITQMAGLHHHIEVPLQPDLVIHNYGETTPEAAVAAILNLISEKNKT